MLHSWGQRKEGMGLKSLGFHGQPVYEHLNVHIKILFCWLSFNGE